MTARSVVGCRVVVEDLGVDVALIQRDGEPLLVLRPAQSFGAAVRGIRAAAPATPPGVAERIVREHLPEAVNLDELQMPAGITLHSPLPVRRPTRRTAKPALVYGVTGFALGLLMAAMVLSSRSVGEQVRGAAPAGDSAGAYGQQLPANVLPSQQRRSTPGPRLLEVPTRGDAGRAQGDDDQGAAQRTSDAGAGQSQAADGAAVTASVAGNPAQAGAGDGNGAGTGGGSPQPSPGPTPGPTPPGPTPAPPAPPNGGLVPTLTGELLNTVGSVVGGLTGPLLGIHGAPSAESPPPTR